MKPPFSCQCAFSSSLSYFPGGHLAPFTQLAYRAGIELRRRCKFCASKTFAFPSHVCGHPKCFVSSATFSLSKRLFTFEYENFPELFFLVPGPVVSFARENSRVALGTRMGVGRHTMIEFLFIYFFSYFCCLL